MASAGVGEATRLCCASIASSTLSILVPRDPFSNSKSPGDKNFSRNFVASAELLKNWVRS